jgi:hypothetical protein
MNRQTRAFQGVFAVLCLALAVLAAPASVGAAEVVVHYTKESYPTFEAQLNGGQVSAVTFNKRIRSMRVTLKNGEHVLVVYPPHQAAAEIAKVEGKHVHVTVLTPTQAKKETPKVTAHHKLRYIAGGILILVIVVVGAVLYFNRKRKRDSD